MLPIYNEQKHFTSWIHILGGMLLMHIRETLEIVSVH